MLLLELLVDSESNFKASKRKVTDKTPPLAQPYDIKIRASLIKARQKKKNVTIFV